MRDPTPPLSSKGSASQKSRQKQRPDSRVSKEQEGVSETNQEVHAPREQDSEPVRARGKVGNDEPPVTFVERKFTEDIANPMVDVGESNEKPLVKPLELPEGSHTEEEEQHTARLPSELISERKHEVEAGHPNSKVEKEEE